MRVLLCSRIPLRKTLGAAKVVIELAEAMQARGVVCEVRGRDDIVGASREPFPDALRSYLRRRASEFDVLDYDHEDLPFPRVDFPRGVLMVARSVLLIHHALRIAIPDRPGVKHALRRMVKGRRDRAELVARRVAAQATIAAADLVNVSNQADRAELKRSGVPDAKIIVLPYGMSTHRLADFASCSVDVPDSPPMVAFVGSFDYRKGAREMPHIWDRIRRAIPAARLRLIGTRGLLHTEAEVRACFSRVANRSVEIVPRFDPASLPSLLAPCWAGLFPSWIEGFPNGVLEMLAAALPVCAYDAPGPPEMLGPADLVPAGDIAAAANRIIQWCTHPELLLPARRDARERAHRFQWDAIARSTIDAYARALAKRPV